MARAQGLGLLFVAALANAAWAQVSTRFDGQYVGKLTLVKVVSGDCTKSPLGALYLMTISRGQVQFKYGPRFDTVLRGTVAEDGTFQASYALRSGQINMTGQIQGNEVTAHITSPSCRYSYHTRE